MPVFIIPMSVTHCELFSRTKNTSKKVSTVIYEVSCTDFQHVEELSGKEFFITVRTVKQEIAALEPIGSMYICKEQCDM